MSPLSQRSSRVLWSGSSSATVGEEMEDGRPVLAPAPFEDCPLFFLIFARGGAADGAVHLSREDSGVDEDGAGPLGVGNRHNLHVGHGYLQR